MGLKRQNRSKVLKIVSIPATALAKTRDLYVKSMTRWASRASYCHSTWATQQFPRSFSVSSSTSDDLRELIRAASVRSFGYASEIGVLLSPARSAGMSCGAGIGGHMGRIDEDTAEEGGSAGGVAGETTAFVELCPGSKSYAIGKTTAI